MTQAGGVWAALAVATAAGCAEVGREPGDGYPIGVDLTAGAVMLGVRTDDGVDRTAVLELMSPFTVLDDGDEPLPDLRAQRLTVLGAATPGGPVVPRATLTPGSSSCTRARRGPRAPSGATASRCPSSSSSAPTPSTSSPRGSTSPPASCTC
ncbi:MAG: hypothetical protein R2939_13365 [Kofleriaceae bacterium]